MQSVEHTAVSPGANNAVLVTGASPGVGKNISWPRTAAVALLIALAGWHLYFVLAYFEEALVSHIIWISIAITLCVCATGANSLPEQLAFIESWLNSRRSLLAGISAAIMAGLHLLTFSKTEDVLLIMAYVALLLAYMDMCSLAIRAHRYRTAPAYPEETKRSLVASTKHLTFVLGLTLVFSVGTLYAALISVVGFRGVWSVLIFAAVIIGSLGLLIRNRNI